MAGMGETLKSRFGPLPVWAWALIFVGVVYLYLQYRSKQQAAATAQQQAQGTSSNLGTVPVSNLTTAAQPMPIQLGDTFVNSGPPQTISSQSGSPATTLVTPTAANTMQPANVPQPSPATQVQTIC